MSFWAGVASGFKDAKAAKAEKEELEARRAERAETFEYNKGRDEKADARYVTEQAENLRRWQLGHDIQVKTYDENKAWRESQAEREQGNLDRTFTTNEKWKNKEWAQGVDKWKFTKDQAKEATEHSNKLFNMALDKFEYSKDRDVVQDAMNYRAEARAVAEALRVKEAQTFNQEMADKNFELREDQFEEQMRAAGVSEDLAAQGFALKKRAADLAHTKAVVDMIPAPLLGALSGDKGQAVPIGSKTTVAISEKFTANYNTQLTKQEQESPFFKAAISSPSAQASLQAFVDAQANKGNEIELNELPQYFSYLGQVEGKNEKEALEIVQSMMKGDGLKNPEAMAKGLLVLKGYRPTEELFQQTGVPADATKDEKGFGIWKTATANEARLALAKLPEGDRKEKIFDAIAAIKVDKSDPVGYQMLAELGFGKNIQSDYNLADNPIVKSFYGEPVEAEELPETPVEKLPETPAEEPTLAEEGVTSFNTSAEAEAARAEGFSGPAYIGGVYGEIPPLEGTMLSNDAGEELDIEDALAADYGEGGDLKESGAVEQYFDKQADALDKMGSATTEEEVEGSRPGEKEIDTDTFVGSSFKGKGDEAMDLEGASAEIVQDKIFNVVDSLPPRTTKKNRVEWAVKEFKKRYTNSILSDEEIEVRIKSLLSSNQ